MSVNLLLSYAYHAKTDLTAVRRRMHCGGLIVDSGAFSAFTVGKTIRLDEYCAYLERHRGAWDHAITLDKIGDPAATRRNTARMHERGLPVMPVFTAGETLAEFDAMVRDHQYVAVGGLVGSGLRVGASSVPVLAARLGMLQRRAQRQGGGIHALGVGSMAVLHRARPYSADTSTADSVVSYGNVLVFDGRMLRQVHVTAPAQMARYRDVLTSHGIDVAAILNHGRIPPRFKPHLMAAHSVAYACADEVLSRHGVPAPREGWRPGTVLYVAPNGPGTVDLVTAVDTRLHTGDGPSVWTRYGRRHTCYRRPGVTALPAPSGTTTTDRSPA